MFDFSFSELIVIALVALVVIGPERLPKVARTVGLLLGRLQRYVTNVKSDIQREMQLDELKKLQQQVQESAGELERSMQGQAAAVQAQLDGVASDVREAVGTVPAPGSDVPAPAAVAPEPSPQLELGLDGPAPSGNDKGAARP